MVPRPTTKDRISIRRHDSLPILPNTREVCTRETTTATTTAQVSIATGAKKVITTGTAAPIMKTAMVSTPDHHGAVAVSTASSPYSASRCVRPAHRGR